MYELMRAGDNSWYISAPVKLGLYLEAGHSAWLIDTGLDKGVGKKAIDRVTEQGWTLAGILNTHSHADHVGGNAFVQGRTGCKAYAPAAECPFIADTRLEPAFLYGGCPPAPLRGKFLMAPPSAVETLTDESLPIGLEWLHLPGHTLDMAGFRTQDGVCFLADSLSSEQVLDKYQLVFLYDIRAQFETLDRLEALEGRLFIPAHAPVLESREALIALVRLNRARMLEVIDRLIALCARPIGFEELLGQVFEKFGMAMSWEQSVLIGSTVRSYLAYLLDEARVACEAEGTRMVWRAV